MKRVCPNCESKDIVKFGKRRRKCNNCQKTFRVNRQGRKRKRLSEMYLLDRSTFRRIGCKEKYSHQEIIRKLKIELKAVFPPIKSLKKISISAIY